LTGPAPLVFVWDIDGSAGGDFFGWSTAFSMMEIVLPFLPNHDSGGTANRGQVSL
jgi:hypothetical protein